jgi:ATP-dependent DNA helicase DinG
MLSDTLKQEIRTAFENIKAGIKGFNPRGSQNKMIAEISKTLTGVYSEKIISVEAPTGTGKTIAYLISSIPIAKSLKKSLIISSANVALQEQLVFKDIPDIQKYSKLKFSYALVKGRSRYVCVRDLINITEDNQQTSILDVTAVWDKPPAQNQIKQLEQISRLYTTQQWDGDKDSLEITPDNMLWQKIAANRHTCSARRCEFYSDCCFFKARKKINEADVIIANHDLILADLSTGNTILPNVTDSIFIFDEAHHLASKALSHFSNNLWLNGLENTLSNSVKVVEQIVKVSNISVDINKLKHDNNNALSHQRDFIHLISQLDFTDDLYQFTNGIVPDEIKDIVLNWRDESEQVIKFYNDVNKDFEVFCKDNTVDTLILETISSNSGFLGAQLNNLLETLSAFLSDDNPKLPPKCRWLEKKESTKEIDYQINVSNIDVSKQLQSMLWNDCAGSVLTSATLTALGSFSRLQQKTGLSPDYQYLRLASPFNHQNIPFNIAQIACEPNAMEFSDLIADALVERINPDEGSLVLFASNKQMQYVGGLIEKKLNCTLFIQGEFSKQMILEKHTNLRKQNKGSVIFGLDSFSEGVDLPGKLLTHVLIIKLRFSVPTSPIEKATQEYLENQNQNPFREISLPDASLRLIQACGRLIRTETDTGQITIFDRRLVSKFYGKQLLSALPPFNIIIEQ